MIHKSPLYLLPSFKTIGLTLQEKRLKIYFLKSGHIDRLGMLIETIFAIFDPQNALILPIECESVGPSVQEKKLKIFFKMAALLAILAVWISNQNEFSYF